MNETPEMSRQKQPTSFFRNRLMLVLGIGLIILGYALSKTFVPQYQATSTIRVDVDLAWPQPTRNPDIIDNALDPGSQNMNYVFGLLQLDSIVMPLKTADLMAQVIQDHSLMSSTEFTNAAPDPQSLNNLANTLLASTTLQRRSNSELYDISVRHHSKRLAPDLANWIGEGMAKKHAQNKALSNQLATQVLTNEAERLKVKLRKAEVALIDFRRSSGLMIPLEQKREILETRIIDLSNKLSSMDLEIKTLEDDLTLAQGDAHRPENEENKRVLDTTPQETESKLSKLGKERETLSTQLISAEEESLNLSAVAVEYNVLNREVETMHKLYNAVMERVKEIDISAGLQNNPISVVEEASTVVRLSPSPWVITLLPLAIVITISLAAMLLMSLFGLRRE